MITQFIDLCQDKASDLPSTREDETVAVSHHLIMEMVTEKKPPMPTAHGTGSSESRNTSVASVAQGH